MKAAGKKTNKMVLVKS